MNYLDKIVGPVTKINRIMRLCPNKKMQKLIDCICWQKGADETQIALYC